ncbi:SET domain-containing protein [Suhomyces tanzawaensis NRRL Y-17324]|uniref:Ribosomal lysine N-methyltransferase 4 n=1 Tax=Suhomyces tanzawaensis NRRL Y-17324 TaxID=984487 RepID=A0A1E4SH53_9ASCO|nr:SET domain-containing protein [Suhomyces tanzawaensis NRRL Y-17324]ODV78817.1 SET domain-containing protein [Suhomyces tanzawaensis NRRL Y-17324]
MPFETTTKAFIQWLAEHNVSVSPKVEIADLRAQNQGRGLVATQDIKDDEVLFTIPRSAMLNVDNSSLVTDHPELRPKLFALNQWESLIITLLYEIQVKKQDSPWHQYFCMLPILDSDNYTFNQLMFWSEKDLKHLEPSLILDRIGKDISEAMYAKLFPTVVVQDLGLALLQLVTLEDYHRVASIIMSYSFDVDRPDFDSEEESEDEEDEDEEEDEENNKKPKNDNSKDASSKKAKQVKKNHDAQDDDASYDDAHLLNDGYFKSMIPLADTLNANTNLHNASLMYTEDNLVMKSIKPIRKGDQVYNIYSDHPNSEILRRYGYIEPNGSKYDFGEIPLGIIRDFFVQQSGLSVDSVQEIFSILNKVVEIEQEESEMVEIVLDSYDCFTTSEVILELIFLIQILTIISSIHRINSMELLAYEPKFQLVSRVFKKTYQLIESKRLTKVFLANFEQIIAQRLAQYPEVASEPFEEYGENIGQKSQDETRRIYAQVVLKSEVQSLKNCLKVEKTFQNGDFANYKFIDDGKFIRNIIKKRFSDDSTSEDEVTSKKARAT